MTKRTFIALAIISACAVMFIFNSFYKEAKNTAIKKLNKEQSTHAMLASRGIEDFFSSWTRDLNTVSVLGAIINNDAAGHLYLKRIYENNQDQIYSVTRLDETGKILYNFPSINSVKTDISEQKHVRELLRDHKPVVSDVFKAVEGFYAVALHVPVFKKGLFKGSVGVLINFESLAKHYLDIIKIGDTGYAWVISRDGTHIYSQIPGFTGNSVFENIKGGDPLLRDMVNEMLKGHEGTATFTFDKIRDRNVKPVKKYAIYMPVHIGSTFWSIAVSSAEDDVLSGLTSFRNKLVLVSIILFICGILFSALGVKIWFLFDEIEKRKNAERKTIESEIRLKLAVESAGLGLWNVHEKDGQIWGTDAARALYGFTPEESIHVEDFLSKVHDDDRERVVQSMDEAFQSHKPFSEEYRTILPDGSIRWISANGRYNSTPGMLTGLMGVSTNITERKLIEQSLQKERLFSELVLESLPGIFYLYTIPDMRLIQWNKNHEKMTGFSHEELYNKHVLDWFQPADQEAVRQALATVTDHGSVVMQTDILAKDGGILSLQSTGTLFVDNERQYFMGIGIDVSERLMIEQDLKRYQEHLEELVTERTADLQRARELAETANQAKSTFLTYMSHEIRTPLTAVLGFAHLLERDTSLSTQGHSNTQTIIKSGEYLLSIINDILAMSQIESGQLVLRTTVVDLKQLIYDLAAMFRYRAEEKGIALIIDYSEQMPAFIMADIGKLRQVLINLLGNAFKFTMHGSITMRVYLAGVERIAIEIIDTGIGIAPDEQEKLFLPFVCSGSDEQIPSGTGLGLAISREYAQLMGGAITVDSTVNSGSVFHFECNAPATTPGTLSNTMPLRVTGLAPGQGEVRVLVVDDNQNNRELLRSMLDPLGFIVDEVLSGEEALEKVRTWVPGIILMDLVLPGKDGAETSRILRDAYSKDSIIIIGISASAFDTEKQHFLDSGINAFLAKPFRQEELYDLLARYAGVQFKSAETETGLPDEAKNITLDKMSSEWIEQFNQALVWGNITLIRALGKEANAIDPALSAYVTNQVALYNLDGLKIFYAKNHPSTNPFPDNRI